MLAESWSRDSLHGKSFLFRLQELLTYRVRMAASGWPRVRLLENPRMPRYKLRQWSGKLAAVLQSLKNFDRDHTRAKVSIVFFQSAPIVSFYRSNVGLPENHASRATPLILILCICMYIYVYLSLNQNCSATMCICLLHFYYFVFKCAARGPRTAWETRDVLYLSVNARVVCIFCASVCT